ncbi:uncharacterized protein TRIADDRAFT_52179 [Trichoplax adhaerens]|uniref:Uncharacterized protein n=1 Tax=Trichoplax adhaerens TaxID=10228 RepID=B3RLZ6_TRIAD|nr:predicted protein [Trichoplax adhaerens]EDV29611.1 predicted protein [Trichoplax adhaerens]|eukprot:XP_002108813.1 predicted protein [Trichoplax adhaerens]
MNTGDKIAALNGIVSTLYTGVYVMKNISGVPVVKGAVILCSGFATWGVSRWCWIKLVDVPIEQGQLFCPACALVRGSATTIVSGSVIPSLVWLFTSSNRSAILKLLTQPIKVNPLLGFVIGCSTLQVAIGGFYADRKWKGRYLA